MRLRFGDCAFDRGTRELVRDGKIIHTGPKVLGLLEILLDVRPEALTKDRIHRALWPDTFVSEATLSSLVAELRAAIGDDARAPTLVRTIHGYGYAFFGEVTADVSSAGPRGSTVYRLIYGDREIRLQEGETILGRSEEATIYVDATGVSRLHARILIRAEGAALEDLGSKNGTFVDGERIQRLTPLPDGATFMLGATPLRLRSFNEPLSTSTLTAPNAAGAKDR